MAAHKNNVGAHHRRQKEIGTIDSHKKITASNNSQDTSPQQGLPSLTVSDDTSVGRRPEDNREDNSQKNLTVRGAGSLEPVLLMASVRWALAKSVPFHPHSCRLYRK